MIRILISILLIICSYIGIRSQNIPVKDTIVTSNAKDGKTVQAKVVDGDTLIEVALKPIIIRPPLVFTSNKQVKRYSKLILYVKKVYPYSQIVSQQLEEIHAHLGDYKTEKEKKEYLKLKESELKAQFEGELRKLTFTQGRILIKLINRETGVTTFDIVKELKGSLNAFFWQSVARLFGSNLKLEYDPNGEDKMIEDIVVRIENGEL